MLRQVIVAGASRANPEWFDPGTADPRPDARVRGWPFTQAVAGHLDPAGGVHVLARTEAPRGAGEVALPGDKRRVGGGTCPPATREAVWDLAA
jgi:hypothetical protein